MVGGRIACIYFRENVKDERLNIIVESFGIEK